MYTHSYLGHRNALDFVLELSVDPAACHAYEDVQLQADLVRSLRIRNRSFRSK
jgi:hypothetical protein